MYDLPERFPDVECGPRLRRFIDSLTPMEKFSPIIVGSPAHWFVTQCSLVGDNSTGGRMVPIEQFKRYEVNQALIVSRD